MLLLRSRQIEWGKNRLIKPCGKSDRQSDNGSINRVSMC